MGCKNIPGKTFCPRPHGIDHYPVVGDKCVIIIIDKLMPGDLEVDPKGDQQQERNEKDILFTGRWGYFFLCHALIVP